MVIFDTLLFIVINLIFMCFSKKPHSKHQQSIWRLECELGIISDPECPVDGGWSPWGAWSECHGLCNAMGHRTRRRECNNPPTSKDGIPCSGAGEQIETCYLTHCTVNDYKKLVEGDSIRMKTFHQLEAVPALMERCLQIDCPFEAIESALSWDNTWQLNAEVLWNAFQCVKHNLGCTVIGEWGPWGTWSACGARCGHGLRWRLRRCDNPPPSDARLLCSGAPLQVQGCKGDQCSNDLIDYEDGFGQWSNWGPWTKCSENCGTGIRRRRRICSMTHKQNSLEIWGTYCRGQHDQLEICKNPECVLHGGWSDWSSWGPCSQTCGSGRRSRSRTCTRPMPTSSGQQCDGPRTEVSSCHLQPCTVYSHIVAVLNGESNIQYDKNNNYIFFHFYIRFKPLSPRGTLVRKGLIYGPYVRLSLQKWHVCLDARGLASSCDLPRMCTTEIIEPAIWHTALVTVSSDAATLRLDDSELVLRNTFPCDPILPNYIVNIYVGERFHGEIEEVICNFTPFNLMIDRRRIEGHFQPSYVSNVAYEKSTIEESYLTLHNTRHLRIPCFKSNSEWNLGLTVKATGDSGTLVFIKNYLNSAWFCVALQNMRLKLTLAYGNYRTESSTSWGIPPDQWLDLQISKKDLFKIEASVNGGEHIHVLANEDMCRKQNQANMNTNLRTHKKSCNKLHGPNYTTNYRNIICSDNSICLGDFFIGGVPGDIKKTIPEEFISFNGIIASLSINGVLQDLRKFDVEKYEDGVHLSSRAASVSRSYYETAWDDSHSLNLTCLHTRFSRSTHSAYWLFLDVSVDSAFKDKKFRAVDDGRVLRLVTSRDNDLRGFYTCRAHVNSHFRNIVTYGVLGKVQYQLTGPDVTTLIAVFTTVSLVLGTLLWLIVEGVHDLRKGYGFFRDAHLSPEEEAEAVCKFIDENLNLIGSKSEAKIAKAKARQKAKLITSKFSFTTLESQDLLELHDISNENQEGSTSSGLEDLPSLPEVKYLNNEQPRNVFRCEPCYISSPRHGSFSTPRSKLSSYSTPNLSPRRLCSRFLLTKQNCSENQNMRSVLPNTSNFSLKPRSNLFTIKSSSFVNASPAQKILQRFKALKSEDYLTK